MEELGYKLNNGKAWGRFLVTFRIKETNEWKYVASPEWDLQNNPDIDVSIDCGTNEDLFLALAALREDTDKGQWFCDNNDLWEQTYSDLPSRYMQMNGHKATVEEIIEHFKN